MVRGIIEELDEEVDMQAFREQVRLTLEKMRAGAKSAVPAGREHDFPNIVFQEQFASALAASLGIDLNALQALETNIDEKPKYKLLHGIEH